MRSLNSRIWLAVLVAVIACLPLAAPEAVADEVRRLAIHVDDNDPAKMNMALNNAANVRSYYESQGIKTQIRIVAYGPGLNMLRADKSPVAARIEQMSLEDETLSFAACGNTLAGMTKKEGKEVALLEEAEVVPSGVVELMELQRQGWSYIRP